MRKLFKKALACCLVAALALTCFVGALSVSAETYTGTLNVATIEVAADATEAIVPVTIESANALNAAKITVAASEGWEVSAIAIDAASTAAKIEPENINGDTFIVEAVDNIAGFTTATVNVTFTSKAAVAATITATLDPVHAATWNEDVVNLAVTDGAITVKAAVVEPELDPTLKLVQAGASVTDSLGIAYVIQNSVYNTKYAKVEMEVVAKKYDTNRDLVVTDPVTIPFVAVNAALSTATYSGIAMFEIDQDLTAKIKAYDAEGNYVAYSNDIVANPASALKNLYATSKSDLYKTMVTDMLNLGTEAQAYFGKVAATNNPDNDLLANYNTNPINKDWDQTYATKEMPALNLVNDTKWADNSPLTASDLMFIPSLNLAATPTVSYVCMDKANKFTSADLKMEVSYTAVYPKAFAGLKTQVIEGSDWQTAGKNEVATFNKMTLTDSNCEVTAKLYYKDQLVLTSTFTMDQGIQTQANSANSKALATALAKFETAARNYFASV